MYYYWKTYIRGDFGLLHSIEHKKKRDTTIKRLIDSIACIPHCSIIMAQQPYLHDIRPESLRFYKKRLSLLLAESDLDKPCSNQCQPFREYDEFYNLFVFQYKFLRIAKQSLHELYRGQPFLEPIFEEIYHPDRVMELRELGVRFTDIVTILDDRINAII